MQTTRALLAEKSGRVYPSEPTTERFRVAGMVVITNEILCTGKTSAMEALAQKGTYAKVPSWVTREMRSGETQGDPYIFVSEDEMVAAFLEGLLIEMNANGANMDRFYATHILPIEAAVNSGKMPIKDVDTKGFINIRSIDPNSRAIVLAPDYLTVDGLQDAWTLRIYGREGRPEAWPENKVQDMIGRFAVAIEDVELRLPAYFDDPNILFVMNQDLGSLAETVDAWIRRELSASEEDQVRRLAIESLMWTAERAREHKAALEAI
ncbi:hypothetical protein H6798_00530 [Candidatus Nomurabacteria bacterium]|nr:hypothetical protein [Candidatus Nomurabacteria bacterium]